MLYALCKPKVEARQLSDEQFGRSMSGDALLQGSHALLEGLSDFFPNAWQRAVMQGLLRKTNQVVERLLDHAESTIAGIEPDAVAQSASASCGSLPARSASIPVT